MDHEKPAFLRGPLLVASITSVCSAGFLLFGYDQGVMSGVNISNEWLDTVDHPSSLMLGTITALYDVGAVFGAIGAALTAESLGRKKTLMLGAGVLCIGAILMASSYERIQFMVGRVITGIGIGYITSVTPVYQSEISSSAQRGWQVCCQLTTMLFGLMLAYWINYGCYFQNSSMQWRFPLAFQTVFTLYILIVTPFLPGISANKRFYLAIGIQFMQQMTGINIVTYYAPTLYTSSLGMSDSESLFLGAWTQVWYVLASFVTWYTIDRIGRRKLFISMGLGMCAVLVAEAICVAVGGTSASIAAVVFVFLFEACFTWGWMATVWIYPAEILPLKIRAKGASLAAAADFLGNFLVVEVTPIGLDNIGWRFYLVWAVLNLVNAFIVFLFYPETGGLQLEAVDQLFVRSEDMEEEHLGMQKLSYKRLQWSVVGKSIQAVKASKAKRKFSKDSDESMEVSDTNKGPTQHTEQLEF